MKWVFQKMPLGGAPTGFWRSFGALFVSTMVLISFKDVSQDSRCEILGRYPICPRKSEL
jgi:hypothetical protein